MGKDIKVDMFPKILVKIDGKFVGNTGKPPRGRGMLINLAFDKDWQFKEQVVPYALYAQMNYDRNIIQKAIYADLSGVDHAEIYIKDKEIPDWMLPEYVTHAS